MNHSSLSPPPQFQLLPNMVEVWHADLNLSPEQRQQFYLTLSEDEQQRAKRFRFERDRYQYIAARGILRSLLGKYTNTPPAELTFNYSPKGKPELKDHSLYFNVSHSQARALYGISLNHRVGVDLEYIRPLETLSLAQRFFTPAEFEQITAVPSSQQQQVFFQLWTAKEAYLKATGAGLGELETIEINLDKMQLFKSNQLLSHWSIHPIQINPDYVATVAVESPHPTLNYWSDNLEIMMKWNTQQR